MSGTTITLMNTGLPLFLIALLAGGLPWWLISKDTRCQKRVAMVIGISAVLMLGISALIMALFDKRDFDAGDRVLGYGFVAWLYLRGSLGAVVVWGPILLFVWLGLAQRVERLRGEDMAKGEIRGSKRL